ncbi:MAG: type III-B CRISPR-associated protein Cas10/Cmr2, partial [Saprospiraceae bacterium]
MAEKMTHLFLFTLGPVQGFIAQARKTRDLYAGSQILSALVAEGMRTFEKEFPNGKIIFPSAAGNADEASLPNRFIAKVSTDKSELKAKGEAIQRAVEAKWEAIAEKSLQRAGIDPKSEQVK